MIHIWVKIMNKNHELSNLQKINFENLNRGTYFQSLLMEAIYNDLIDQKQAEKIKMDLMFLLKSQTDKYTSGDSSSVRVEIAEQITQSIYYCIGSYLKTIPEVNQQIDILNQEKVETLFNKGIEVTKVYLDKTKLLLKLVSSKLLNVNNQAYQDTIVDGIFFTDYDIRYGAYEIPGSIDYPLSIERSDLLGIEYIYEYLLHLGFENDFCSNYSDNDIEVLLRGYNKDYSDILINIYELVLTNALACTILGKTGLDITEEDRKLLQEKLSKYTQAELVSELDSRFQELCNKFKIINNIELKYLSLIIKPIASRIENSLEFGKLETVFISQKEKTEEDLLYYEDGFQMEDDELRYLIEELQECRFLEDKIEIIQQNIRSLSDLIEVLEECFYGDEIYKAFELLGANELLELKKIVLEAQEDNRYSDSEEKQWHIALIDYLERK